MKIFIIIINDQKQTPWNLNVKYVRGMCKTLYKLKPHLNTHSQQSKQNKPYYITWYSHMILKDHKW